MHCPRCHSSEIVKFGHTPNTRKQKHKCNSCGRQFVENPDWQPVSEDQKALINRLLLERISLAGIARAVQVSESWLQEYVNQVYQETPRSFDEKKSFKADFGM